MPNWSPQTGGPLFQVSNQYTSLSNTLIFKHIQHHNFNIRLLTRALVLRWNPSLAFILWMVKIFILKRDSIVQRRNFALEYFCFCCCWVLFFNFFFVGGGGLIYSRPYFMLSFFINMSFIKC